MEEARGYQYWRDGARDMGDNEAMRRLEDLASNTPELVGQIREWVHTSPEKMRRKVSEYLESIVGATTPWQDASKPFRIL